MKYLVALATLLCVQGLARAHASAVKSEPAVGAEVRAAPAAVKVWFNVGIDPTASKIEVFDAGGKQVDKRDSHLDGKSTRTLVVSLPPLPPGVYKVRWEAVSADTHRTRNDFKFVVKP